MGFFKIFCHRLCSKTILKCQSIAVVDRLSFDFNHVNQFIFEPVSSAKQLLFCRYYSRSGSHSFTNFQDVMQLRRNQAKASVLIELPSKDDACYVASLCKEYGDVKTILSYTGEHNEIYLLTEFDQVESADKFINACQVKNIHDSYPLCSRLIHFERKKKNKRNNLTVSPKIIEVLEKPLICDGASSASDMIKNLYKNEVITELSTRLRFVFGCLIEDSLKGMFPKCAVLPFGSSVNGFGKEGCDLDLMLRLYADKSNLKSEFYFQTKTCIGDIKVLQQRSIACIYELLRAFFPGVSYIQRILHARIPILKFRHKILNIECDISVNNMTAVYMSEILYFLGELDPRVRPLVFTVKKWAKLASITYDSPGSWITNFQLTLLVLYFLQNRPTPIIPPLLEVVNLSACYDMGPLVGVEYLDSAKTWSSMVASRNDESFETLLLEFFNFVASFDFEKKHISLLTSEALQVESGYPLWIQYPLEEDMNVAKNVSVNELHQLREIARTTAENFTVQRTSNIPGDIVHYLGIEILKRKYERIDISALMEDRDTSKKKGVQRVQ